VNPPEEESKTEVKQKAPKTFRQGLSAIIKGIDNTPSTKQLQPVQASERDSITEVKPKRIHDYHRKVDAIVEGVKNISIKPAPQPQSARPSLSNVDSAKKSSIYKPTFLTGEPTNKAR